METRKISIFLRLIMAITIICIIMLFIVDFLSAEFYIMIISVIIGITITFFGFWHLKKIAKTTNQDKENKK